MSTPLCRPETLDREDAMLSLRTLLLVVLFLGFSTPLQAEQPRKLLLVGQGPDGHPPATHEYIPGLKVLAACLENVKGLEITTVRADGAWKEGPELMARADGVVLFVSEGARWISHDPARKKALLEVLARGGGIVVLHWGMGTRDADNIPTALEVLGGCHGGPDRRYKVLETDLTPASHPITTGIEPFRTRDEYYYRLKLAKDQGKLHPILTADIDGSRETVAWAWERPGGGRTFGFSGLHFHDRWSLPAYRRLVAQGVLWTLGLPIPDKGLPVKVAPAALQLP